MTFEADLRTHLLGDAAIAAALNDQAANESRFYPGQRPQGQKNLAALVYTVVAGAPGDAANLDGDDSDAAGGLEAVRLQLDVWGASHDVARDLARLVIARMSVANNAISSTRLSRASDRDPETGEHRQILEFSVWHTPQ